jgi:hypothetical protein
MEVELAGRWNPSVRHTSLQSRGLRQSVGQGLFQVVARCIEYRFLSALNHLMLHGTHHSCTKVTQRTHLAWQIPPTVHRNSYVFTILNITWPESLPSHVLSSNFSPNKTSAVDCCAMASEGSEMAHDCLHLADPAMLSKIDQLFVCKIGQIVVVGNQSSGKSSVLSTIIFPFKVPVVVTYCTVGALKIGLLKGPRFRIRCHCLRRIWSSRLRA